MKPTLTLVGVGFFMIGGLLASLGIGGLAVALAAKDTLSNVFGSLMIILDRPFHVGDRDVENTGQSGEFLAVRLANQLWIEAHFDEGAARGEQIPVGVEDIAAPGLGDDDPLAGAFHRAGQFLVLYVLQVDQSRPDSPE